jgi:hypothetical protein
MNHGIESQFGIRLSASIMLTDKSNHPFRAVAVTTVCSMLVSEVSGFTLAGSAAVFGSFIKDFPFLYQ